MEKYDKSGRCPFKVPSGYFVGGAEEKYKNLQFPTAGLRSEILIFEPDNKTNKQTPYP